MFLAYLGGLLVVFLYSIVLASSPYFGGVAGLSLVFWVFFRVLLFLGLLRLVGGGERPLFLGLEGRARFFVESDFRWLGNP